MRIYKALQNYEDGIIEEFLLGAEVVRSQVIGEISPEEVQALFNVFGAIEEFRFHNPNAGQIIKGEIQHGIETKDWELYQSLRTRAGLV